MPFKTKTNKTENLRHRKNHRMIKKMKKLNHIHNAGQSTVKEQHKQRSKNEIVSCFQRKVGTNEGRNRFQTKLLACHHWSNQK